MKKILGLFTLLFLGLCCGCKKEETIYEVGKIYEVSYLYSRGISDKHNVDFEYSNISHEKAKNSKADKTYKLNYKDLEFFWGFI